MNLLRLSALFLFSVFCAPLHAAVTSAFDGNWYDPSQPGQGFIFETYPLEGGELQLVVIYFTYDANGQQVFYTATSPIQSEVVVMTLMRPTIRSRAVDGLLPAPVMESAGTLTVRFFGCQVAAAEVLINSSESAGFGAKGASAKVRVGTGSFSLSRLGNSVQVKRCTGGISDDSFAGTRATGFDQFFSTPQLSARAVFERRPDASELRLEFRNLPVGSYNLDIGGVAVAGFNVAPYANGTRAEVRFRSPVLPGQRLLDFDALGQSFSIHGTEGSNLAINQAFVLPRELTPLGVTSAQSGSTEARYNQTFNAAQVNGYRRGIQSNFLIDASYERSSETQELRVSVEGVEVGIYDVYVANQRRGQIELKSRGSQGEVFGEVLFRFPVTVGAYPLDFEPRGVQLELRREQTTEYAVTLAR